MSEAPTGEPDRDVIVRFDDVSKQFRHFESQPFLLRNLAMSLIGRAAPRKELWPLKNVSFELYAGEPVAILGRNGAGKSTMLRMIAGACYPTNGKISVRGRIAPLLSLGIGFHPDMTGRECVFMNAAILGMTREETEDCLPSISAFAEIESFMNTPMRFYSSGMQARLGFAVGVHTAPDLLLVDEVLSVGDHAFQKKCMDCLQLLQDEGTTLVFVSHSADAVRSVCKRALWLHEGRIELDGPSDLVDGYLKGTAC